MGYPEELFRLQDDLTCEGPAGRVHPAGQGVDLKPGEFRSSEKREHCCVGEGPLTGGAELVDRSAAATRLGHRPLRVSTQSCLDARPRDRRSSPGLSPDPPSGETPSVAGIPALNRTHPAVGERGLEPRTPGPPDQCLFSPY